MNNDLKQSWMTFDLWNHSGRFSKGEELEIYVNDKEWFPGKDEVEITFDVHDGFAVGNYQGREYLMLYPLMDEVRRSPNMREAVENYVGHRMVDETGLQVYDIAMTYGKISGASWLPMNLGDKDRVVRMDLNITAEEAAELINAPGLDVDDIPVKDNDRVQKGYLVLREGGGVDFWDMPKMKANKEKLEMQALEATYYDTLETLDLMANFKYRYKGFTDIKARTENDRNYTLSCKLFGVQMPDKPLNDRERTKFLQYMRIHDMEEDKKNQVSTILAVSYPGLMKKYEAELGRVNDVSLYRKANGLDGKPQWMIRCKVDGEQQMGKELPGKLNDTLNKLTKDGTRQANKEVWNDLSRTLAFAQYHDVMNNVQQDLDKGMKR